MIRVWYPQRNNKKSQANKLLKYYHDNTGYPRVNSFNNILSMSSSQ